MGKIVAIGGGDLRTLETLAIDREIVRLSGKTRPRALFIPTASSDSVEYWEAFHSVYGSALGCETAVFICSTQPHPGKSWKKESSPLTWSTWEAATLLR